MLEKKVVEGMTVVPTHPLSFVPSRYVEASIAL